MADDRPFFTRIRESRKYYFCFTKAVLFAIASFFSRAVVDYAFLGYIFVLIQEETRNIKTAALISTAYECVSPFVRGFLGRPSYNLMPYLVTNLITDASFVAGILTLWFTDWNSGILYLALALLAVGRTGDEFTSRFLYHYIDRDLGDDITHDFGDDVIRVKLVLDRIDVWRSIARCPGAILGLWISNLERKSSAFKILAIVTIIGYVFLICGILYHKCPKNEGNQGDTTNPSQGINQSNQVCSRIKQAMQLRKLLLLYIPFLIYYVVQGAGNTFFYQPLVKLDPDIENVFLGPATSFDAIPNAAAILYAISDAAAILYAIQKASGFLTSLLMEILIITKLWKESEQWQCAKLILGMFVCFCCCICSWSVESRRLNSKHMSNLWMIPQFVLLGIAKELVEDGMEDVFFSHVKTSMHPWVSAFSSFVEGLGASLAALFIVVFGKWIRDHIDESHLDKYYFSLAMLTILAIIFFIGLWKFYAPKIKPKDEEEITEISQSEGDNNPSRSQPPQSRKSPAESTTFSSDQVELVLSSNLDTTKSSSNIDLSVLKRSSSYSVQPSNPAANAHLQRFHTHPRTNYEVS